MGQATFLEPRPKNTYERPIRPMIDEDATATHADVDKDIAGQLCNEGEEGEESRTRFRDGN